ncbi:MAG: CsgG/HfaB family protein [Fidelibacterota bacterium]
MTKPWMKPISIFLSWSMLVGTFPVSLSGQITQTVRGEGPVTVAVLDMEGRGISALEAQTLTDRMRSELVNTGAVTVVERGQMQEVLEEQGFQQTGCTSAECAVEVGKLLGVSEMVTGSIGKIGQSYTIDVRMFSVETGAISKSVNRTYKGEVDGLIMEIERMSWDIVGLSPPSGRFPEEKAEVAEVTPPAVVEEGKPEKKGGFGRILLTTVVLAALGGGGYYYYTTLQEEAGKTLPGPPALPD